MSTILQNHYVLAVQDERRSAGFYVRILGFQIVPEPEGWIFVAKDRDHRSSDGVVRAAR